MDYRARRVTYIAGTPYWGAEVTRHPCPGGHYGELIAWDAVNGASVFRAVARRKAALC